MSVRRSQKIWTGSKPQCRKIVGSPQETPLYHQHAFLGSASLSCGGRGRTRTYEAEAPDLQSGPVAAWVLALVQELHYTPSTGKSKWISAATLSQIGPLVADAQSEGFNLPAIAHHAIPKPRPDGGRSCLWSGSLVTFLESRII